MRNHSVIEQTAMASPLLSSSQLNPRGGRSKRTLVATVILTSLVDAFSILVIYLLVNMSSSGEIIYLSKDMELPAAQQTDILERGTLVKIEKGQYYLEDKPVDAGGLVAGLVQIHKDMKSKSADGEPLALTIQADRRTEYQSLSRVVLASSQAGFEEVKFAVLAE